jgi:glycosyltransferase involved in cell wall biosynthesis/SAM-dependent methyltransferase
MTITILIISHKQRQCGVHEFGKNIAETIKNSRRYHFKYVECDNMDDLKKAIGEHQPAAVIYNYHSSTMPWLTEKIVHTKYRPLNRFITLPQIGIFHEVTQEKADKADDTLFNYHVAPDPTLLLRNPIVYKTGRLIPQYENPYSLPAVPVIGSFGFATPNKGFEEIVKAVQQEFDKAIIRFNIPAADFADNDGSNARLLTQTCRDLIKKPGIELNVSHNFLSKDEILDFLAQNSINVFLYQDKTGRGISSTTDYALAVERPLMVSDSIMFRHLHGVVPSIVYGQTTFNQVIQSGIKPLERIKADWDSANMIWEFERIMDDVLRKEKLKKQELRPGVLHRLAYTLRSFLRMRKKAFTWLRTPGNTETDDLTVDPMQSYTPVNLPAGTPLNRILDNNARALYAPAIRKITELVPLTMAKKIPEANVQQGFVFDTVLRFLKNYRSPKILCVGSYEDTGAMSLKRLGIDLEGIDPVLNYYLQEYVNKPGVVKGSYDIIFSTSVIEHDPDDESFVRCINELLAPGGVAIITCDYKDQWKPGDPKPAVDARFYTQHDLRNRLPAIMKGCVLVDEPQWDCPNPDFNYLGKYQYTFATFVVRKPIP